MRKLFLLVMIVLFALPSRPGIEAQQAEFDVLIRDGLVYDGSGGQARRVDVGIKGDRIAAIGDLKSAKAATTIDAN